MYTATPTKPVERQSALAAYRYDALDELLYDWFCREQGYQPVEGYARTAVACDQSVSSRQWDSIEEVLESRVEAFVMPTIASAIDELDGDDRLAIMIEMRNRMGPQVWRNPRVGANQPAAYQAAKLAVSVILRRKGVEW